MYHFVDVRCPCFKWTCKRTVNTVVDEIIFNFFCLQALPPACRTFEGANDIDCFNTIWANAGCTMQGYEAPTNRSQANLEVLRNTNIKQVLIEIIPGKVFFCSVYCLDFQSS